MLTPSLPFYRIVIICNIITFYQRTSWILFYLHVWVCSVQFCCQALNELYIIIVTSWYPILYSVGIIILLQCRVWVYKRFSVIWINHVIWSALWLLLGCLINIIINTWELCMIEEASPNLQCLVGIIYTCRTITSMSMMFSKWGYKAPS